MFETFRHSTSGITCLGEKKVGKRATTVPVLGNAMAGKCCVCSSRDVDEGNVILKCTQCYMLVHQACYGVETVPGEHLMPHSPAQHNLSLE
jgi:hypothetical protein